jgi:hypothetical protein
MAQRFLSHLSGSVDLEPRRENCRFWAANTGDLLMSQEVGGLRLKMARCVCEEDDAPVFSMPTGDAIPFTSAGACCPAFELPDGVAEEVEEDRALYRSLDLYLARQVGVEVRHG